MLKIIWSDKALNDLENIYTFYYHKNPFAANRIYNSILDEISRLRNHPNIAAIEPLLKNNFRSLVTSNGLFKIVYDIHKNHIAIIQIWACRRNPKEFLSKK